MKFWIKAGNLKATFENSACPHFYLLLHFDINANRALAVENLIKTTTQFVSQHIKTSKISITLKLAARSYIQKLKPLLTLD